MAIKPDVLKNAKDISKLQAAMKADLKKSVGKRNLKFVAAKNYTIGSKKTALFILTDTPAAFETLIKEKDPKAYRAKGTVDVLKGAKSGTFQVTIRSSSGQITPDSVAALVRPAVASEKSITAIFARPTDKIGDVVPLKPTTTKVIGGKIDDWTKKRYRKQAKRTIIASMTSNGKIGSVYFGDGSRIRTTHTAGPEREKHGDQETVQYNLDDDKAIAIYERTVKVISTAKDWDDYSEWLANALNNTNVSDLPDWIIPIKGPQDAHDLAKKGAPTGKLTLFEIFKGINGDVEGWHPSRGTATKFETDKQTISVLKAAIKYIDGQGSPKIPKVTDPAQRNVQFYAFVKSRLPNFVQFIREPKDV